MVFSLKKHFATERRPLDYWVNNFSKNDLYADTIIRRLKLEKSKKLLEIGSAQGWAFSTSIPPHLCVLSKMKFNIFHSSCGTRKGPSYGS